MTNYIVTVLVLLILAGGVIALQIFLSKSQSRLPGLILPGISLLISLLLVLSVAAFTSAGKISGTTTSNGTVIEEVVIEREVSSQQILDAVLVAVNVFLLGNIPTVVLLAIYFVCREKMKRRREIEKMSIQDLE